MLREGGPIYSKNREDGVPNNLNWPRLSQTLKYNGLIKKTYSEEQHLVNSRYELLTARQQFSCC